MFVFTINVWSVLKIVKNAASMLGSAFNVKIIIFYIIINAMNSNKIVLLLIMAASVKNVKKDISWIRIVSAKNVRLNVSFVFSKIFMAKDWSFVRIIDSLIII